MPRQRLSCATSRHRTLYGLALLAVLASAPHAAANFKPALYEDILGKQRFEVVDDQKLLGVTRAEAVLQKSRIHIQHLQLISTWQDDLARLFELPVDETLDQKDDQDQFVWYEAIPMQLTTGTTFICFNPLASFPEPVEALNSSDDDTLGTAGTTTGATPGPSAAATAVRPPNDSEDDEEFLPLDGRSQIERGLQLINEGPVHHAAAVRQTKTKNQPQCLHYFQGWWTYEYCPRGHVRQFRYTNMDPQEGISGMNFDYVLGQYSHRVRSLSTPEGEPLMALQFGDNPNAAAHPAVGRAAHSAEAKDVSYTSLYANDEHAYLSQEWSGGTVCDVTGKPRVIQIQYHCVPDETEHIASVHEVAICNYVMVINTPFLCKDPAFRAQPKKQYGEIGCHRLVTDAEYERQVRDHLKQQQQQAHIGDGAATQDQSKDTTAPAANTKPNAAADIGKNPRPGDKDWDLTPLGRTHSPVAHQNLFLRWIEEQLTLASSGTLHTRKQTAWTETEIEAIQTVWQRLVYEGLGPDLEMLKAATERLQPGQNTDTLATIIHNLHHRLTHPFDKQAALAAQAAQGQTGNNDHGPPRGHQLDPEVFAELANQAVFFVADADGNFHKVDSQGRLQPDGDAQSDEGAFPANGANYSDDSDDDDDDDDSDDEEDKVKKVEGQGKAQTHPGVAIEDIRRALAEHMVTTVDGGRQQPLNAEGGQAQRPPAAGVRQALNDILLAIKGGRTLNQPDNPRKESAAGKTKASKDKVKGKDANANPQNPLARPLEQARGNLW
ncbi:Protein OS-9 [Tieghemiomyces parasiticus]|uniref:Protein OS-9 homolog n=1 Tax=Tieghemiomyces parasiticus TaxID=78921 RepID=A0A9W8A5D2_9FUNG|nr:Protein OS-9 [Tieghemiomyces parasiticus]